MDGEKHSFYKNPRKEQASHTHKATKSAYCLYRNLHTGGWSLRFKGKVIEHLPADQAVIFDGVIFPRVEQAGKKRAMAEKQRNVHAYLCSHEKPTIVEHADYAREIIERMGFRRVSYAPFSDLGWHYVDHQVPFRIAEGGILLGGREVWVPMRYTGYRENPECPSFVRKRLKRYFYVRDGQINPDWIKELQAGDVVRIAPHDSAACNYTLTKLDKASDLVEYKDRFDGKPKTSTWSAFLETLKKSWKAELAAFVKAGIERRKERIARAKKRGSKTQIEKAEQELVRFKSAYGKEGLKKSAPPPNPKEIPDEEKPVLPKTKKTTQNKKAQTSPPKKAATKSEVGEIQQELDSEGWLRVDHVRVATVLTEGEAPSGFETYGYEKSGLSYYKNTDGAWEVMHQASGLRLHTLPSEVDARMFAEKLRVGGKIPLIEAFKTPVASLSAPKKKVWMAFLGRVASLKQTQEALQEIVEKAKFSESIDEDEREESETEDSTKETDSPYTVMGEDILAWWESSKAAIKAGIYDEAGEDLAGALNTLQQLAAMERKSRMSGLVEAKEYARNKKLLGDLYKQEVDFLRRIKGLSKEWFPKKSDIAAFARTFIPMLFSGWADKMETQVALRDLANLRLPIGEIEPLLNASDHGHLPAWVYLYHVERIAQELGQPIRYDTKAVDSTVDALGVLGGAVQLWRSFHGDQEAKQQARKAA